MIQHGDLLAGIVFLHHDGKWTLRYHAVLKGLRQTVDTIAGCYLPYLLPPSGTVLSNKITQPITPIMSARGYGEQAE